MNALIAAALALSTLSAGPALTAPEIDRALRNYQSLLVGQKQFPDLTVPERLELLELDRWLHSRDGTDGETKQECENRLSSATPSHLEIALLDLKCSGRPARRGE